MNNGNIDATTCITDYYVISKWRVSGNNGKSICDAVKQNDK